MKNNLFIFISGVALWFSSLIAYAQPGVVEPKWVQHIPTSPSKTYYYHVTYGEDNTYDKAYTKAFARAIYENACKRGITVDIDMSLEAIEQNVQQQVNVDSRTMKLFLNKACEYWRVDAHGKIRLYILWQIGKNGKTDPDFEPYDACDKL